MVEDKNFEDKCCDHEGEHDHNHETLNNQSEDKEKTKEESEKAKQEEMFIKTFLENTQKEIVNLKETISILKRQNQDLEQIHKNQIEDNKRKIISKFANEMTNLIYLFGLSEEGQDLSAVKQGIRMMKKMFLDSLQSFHICSMGTKEGDEFNADLHEAIEFQDTKDENLNNKIYKVISEGFVYETSVIKHARTVVYKFSN